MNSIVSDTINKGIPIDAQITMFATDFLELCDDKDRAIKALKKVIDEIDLYFKSEIEDCPEFGIVQALSVVQGRDCLTKKICYSVEALAATIVTELNLQGIEIVDLFDLFNKDNIFENTIKKLRHISSEKKLEREFPNLYNKYKELVNCKKLAQHYNHVINGYTSTWREKYEARKKLEECFENTDQIDEFLKKANSEVNPRKFANKCADLFEFISMHIDEVVTFMHEHPIDLTLFSDKEQKRFELYVANRYLRYVTLVPEKDKQKYLYYVSNYFLELGNNIGSDVSIDVVDSENKKVTTVTPKILLEKYKKVLISNPSLKIVRLKSVDFSTMSPKEVKEFMDGYLKELSANWEIIPKGSFESTFAGVASKVTSNLSEEEKKAQQEKLANLYLEKKSLYESSDPYSILRGIKTFDGYYAYVYPNGKVILDKYFENVSTGRLAKDNAIYVMNFNDFYELSHLTKRELISHPSCYRIIHAGNWQEKVKNIIGSDGDIDVSKCRKKLVETGKVTSN